MGLARGLFRIIAPSTPGLALIVALGGCSSGSPVPESEPIPDEMLITPVDLPEVDLRASVSGLGLTLEEIPHPDLSSFEESVQQQLHGQMAALDSVLADPNTYRGRLADEMGRMGMLYHIYEQSEAAAACYRNAELLDPREFRWPYFTGRVHADRGRAAEALKKYERALAANPTFVPALYWLAEIHRNRGDSARARAILEKALAADPSSAATRFALGQIALSEGDYGRAVERLEAAFEIRPNAPSLHYALGMAYRGLGDHEKSEEHFDQSSPGTLLPDDPVYFELMTLARGRGASHTRAAYAMNYGRYEYAATEFQRIADAHPDDPWAWVNIGLARLALEEDDAALAALEKAVGVDPDHLQANLHLGSLYARRGDYPRAIEHLKTVLRNDPGELEASFQLAAVLIEVGRHEEAVAELEKVVRGNPGKATAHVQLAMALTWSERYDEALRTLDRAHSAMPEDSRIASALARVLAACPQSGLRDGERAVALIEETVGDGQMNLAQVQTLAMAHAADGDFRKAIRWQERAIDAARKMNRQGLVRVLEANLELYRSETSCTTPWPVPKRTAS
jgi:tetratricopeptide (TPR) repeat protein